MDEAGEAVQLAEVELLRHSRLALTCRIGNRRAMRIRTVSGRGGGFDAPDRKRGRKGACR